MDFRKKKQKKVKPNSEEELTAGNFWCFTAIKRKSMYFPAYHIGQRTNESCEQFMRKFSNTIEKPTVVHKLEVYTDGNFEYQTTLPQYFSEDSINYGQLIKIKKNGRLVEKQKKIIFGNPKIEDIETTYVECHNGIFRGKISRLIRKTKCYSKSTKQLDNHIGFFQFFWNFVNPLHEKESPAMEEGVTHRLWTWGMFLHFRLTFVE